MQQSTQTTTKITLDAEGEEFEVMEESEQMPKLIAPIVPPFQPSIFAAFYPLPPETSPEEGSWREYYIDHRNLID